MSYLIFDEDGNTVNSIVASEEFVTSYCKKHGYTFERLPDPLVPETPKKPAPEPTVWDELAAAYMEGVNSAYGQ